MRPFRTDTIVGSALGTGNGVLMRGALAAPGFLRATATVEVNGKRYTGMATAAFSPEKIEASTTMPGDFALFWQTAIADARRVPLRPVVTRKGDLSTRDVDVYHVSFQNQREGSRLFGVLSVPRRAGKYPALLDVPGAGVRRYYPTIETARKGIIVLSIGIHGIPIDRDSLFYDELLATPLDGYWTSNLEDRDRYYFKRVIVGVIRAGDFLFELPKFDGVNYVVRGGSQGGLLAMAAGALDPRVKGIAVAHPAFADHFAYLRGRAGGWPHVLADTTYLRAKAEKMETLRYYDAVNFARLLKVPGFYTWGFNDLVVPPTSAFAAYNVITARKELMPVVESGHERTKVQRTRMEAWLLQAVGVPDRSQRQTR
jgi:cephalosporin-C deacetylase-like acetyl esterase